MSGHYFRRLYFEHKNFMTSNRVVEELNELKDKSLTGCNIINNIYIISQTSTATTLLIDEKRQGGVTLKNITTQRLNIQERRVLYNRWRVFFHDTYKHWKKVGFIHGDLSLNNIVYNWTSCTFCVIDFYDGVLNRSGLVAHYFERQYERLRWIRLDQYMQAQCWR